MTYGYFYTLSAIAQSFAAIVSLYAIFVIYKLQLLRNQSNELFNRLRKMLFNEMKKPTFDKLREVEIDVNAMSEAELSNWAKSSEKAEVIYSEIKLIKRVSSNIISLFKKTLIINGITIAFSLICLPWGNFIPTAFPVLILIIALGLSLSALYLTINAIWITIKG